MLKVKHALANSKMLTMGKKFLLKLDSRGYLCLNDLMQNRKKRKKSPFFQFIQAIVPKLLGLE